MIEVLDILSRNLNKHTKIGINFFYGGKYNYDKKESITEDYSFNRDKVKTFYSYYVSALGKDNKFFAIIDMIREKFDKDVDVIEKSEIDKNSRIEKEIEKTGVVVYEK